MSEIIRLTNVSDRWVAACYIDSDAPNMRAKTKSEKEEIMQGRSKNWIWGRTTTKYVAIYN